MLHPAVKAAIMAKLQHLMPQTEGLPMPGDHGMIPHGATAPGGAIPAPTDQAKESLKIVLKKKLAKLGASKVPGTEDSEVNSHDTGDTSY